MVDMRIPMRLWWNFSMNLSLTARRLGTFLRYSFIQLVIFNSFKYNSVLMFLSSRNIHSTPTRIILDVPDPASLTFILFEVTSRLYLYHCKSFVGRHQRGLCWTFLLHLQMKSNCLDDLHDCNLNIKTTVQACVDAIASIKSTYSPRTFHTARCPTQTSGNYNYDIFT